MELPLFPLSTILFPGGPLQLRIFEPRYLSMISRCMREAHGFGVVLIDAGSELGAANFVSTGTVAEIVDWSQGHDGLLGIAAEGRERFRIRRWRQQADRLYLGELDVLEAEPRLAMPEEFRFLSRLLEELIEDLGAQYERIPKFFDDATWVGYRLAEILPIPAQTKQSLLEITDARQRLELLPPHLGQIESTPS